MKVSEEIDALRSMGFDPLRWLVVPRCLALAATVPLLTWVGDAAGPDRRSGGHARHHANDGTRLCPGDHVRDHRQLTCWRASSRVRFWRLAIGLIACGQGLLARGGAAAVGARTTTAVVLAIFSVIVISAVFTFFLALMGV